MQYFVVGLGNPCTEYEQTRHNTGAMVLDMFRKTAKLPEWEFDKMLNALISRGSVSSSLLKVKGQELVVLLKPQTFMNKSGDALKQVKDLRFKIKDKKKEIENLVVIHDDLDIPRGSYKLSFNKSSGGHKGVESIIKALKTQAFARIRIGVAPAGKKNQAKKLKDEEKVIKHVLGKWKPSEEAVFKKVLKKAAEAVRLYCTSGLASATQFANTR